MRGQAEIGCGEGPGRHVPVVEIMTGLQPEAQSHLLQLPRERGRRQRASWSSVAVAENAIVSPTHQRDAVGRVTVPNTGRCCPRRPAPGRRWSRRSSPSPAVAPCGRRPGRSATRWHRCRRRRRRRCPGPRRRSAGGRSGRSTRAVERHGQRRRTGRRVRRGRDRGDRRRVGRGHGRRAPCRCRRTRRRPAPARCGVPTAVVRDAVEPVPSSNAPSLSRSHA